MVNLKAFVKSVVKRALLNDVIRNRSGVIVVMFALLLPVLVGALGLGVEVTLWYEEKRELQNVADISALSGAYGIREGNLDDSSTAAEIETVILDNAIRNGYDAITDIFVELNIPPLSGQYAAGGSEDPDYDGDGVADGLGDTGALEVLMTRTVDLLFASYLMETSTVTAATRAVASSGWNTGGTADACVLSLATSGTGVEVTGSADAVYDGCQVAANSDADSSVDGRDDSLDVGGNGSLVLDCYTAVGGVDGTDQITVDDDCVPKVPGDVTVDPYAALDYPNDLLVLPGDCTQTFVTNDFTSDAAAANGTSDADGNTEYAIGWAGDGSDLWGVTATPGTSDQNWTGTGTVPYVLCGDVDLKGTINFAPGLYVVTEDFKINAGAIITGEDVTFVLVNGARINNINGGANLTLEAPDAEVGDDAKTQIDASGTYTGILFYQDLDGVDCTAQNCTNEINGGADMDIEGAIYIPNAPISFSGDSTNLDTDGDGDIDDDDDMGNCVQIVALTVTFTGNTTSYSDNDACDDAGVPGIEVGVVGPVLLVE